MAKRILFIAPDDALAREVAAALPEACPEPVLARSEREALAFIEQTRPDAVVAVDMASRSALGLCNAVRRTPQAAGVPVVVICGPQLGDAVARHQKIPTRADAYLRAPADATLVAEALRALLGLSPAAEFSVSLVPEAPSVPPAAPRVLRAAPPPPPPSPSTASMAATKPAPAPPNRPPLPTAHANANADTASPSRKESGVMPSAAAAVAARANSPEVEVVRLRREAADLARRAAQAEEKLTEAEARARSLAEALETATRQRAEADAEWTEWITSAEKLADEAWRAREGLTREKEKLERELEGANARIAVLEGDLRAERERAKASEEAARGRAREGGAGEADALASAEAEARVMAAEIAAAERLARVCREIRATLAPTPAPADPDSARTTEWVRPDAEGAADPTAALLAREPGAEALPEVVAAVRRLKLERDQFARQAARLADADATIRRLLSEQRQARAEHARALAELESKLAARNGATPAAGKETADALRARVADLERELSEARGARDEVDDLQREVEFLTAEVNRLTARTRQA